MYLTLVTLDRRALLLQKIWKTPRTMAANSPFAGTPRSFQKGDNRDSVKMT